MIKASFLCHPELKYDLGLLVTWFDQNQKDLQVFLNLLVAY